MTLHHDVLTELPKTDPARDTPIMQFELLERVTALEAGGTARGVTSVPAQTDYFRNHFPGYPVVPGVMIVEAIAQLGGRLVAVSVRTNDDRRVLPLLAKIGRARFLRPVRPGDRMDLVATLRRLSDCGAVIEGSAEVSGRPVATVEITYALVDCSDHSGDMNAIDHTELRAWSDRIWNDLDHIVQR